MWILFVFFVNPKQYIQQGEEFPYQVDFCIFIAFLFHKAFPIRVSYQIQKKDSLIFLGFFPNFLKFLSLVVLTIFKG